MGVIKQRSVPYRTQVTVGGWMGRKERKRENEQPVTNSFKEPDYGCGCKSSHHTGGFAAGVREGFSGSARLVCGLCDSRAKNDIFSLVPILVWYALGEQK